MRRLGLLQYVVLRWGIGREEQTDLLFWLMYISVNVSSASLLIFPPSESSSPDLPYPFPVTNPNIPSTVGFTAVRAQGPTAPPFFPSFLITIIQPANPSAHVTLVFFLAAGVYSTP
jgi:hypothetical protein